jgi:putative sterol carrier protein
MARFLTPSWVADQNAALGDVAPMDVDTGASPVFSDRPITVIEEVAGGPDGDVRLVMTVDDGAIRLSLDGAGGEDSERSPTPRPDVTIKLSYEDAASLSRGELSPADALNAGRIRVRGDLSVLVAAQNILTAARSLSGTSLPPTTY